MTDPRRNLSLIRSRDQDKLYFPWKSGRGPLRTNFIFPGQTLFSLHKRCGRKIKYVLVGGPPRWCRLFPFSAIMPQYIVFYRILNTTYGALSIRADFFDPLS